MTDHHLQDEKKAEEIWHRITEEASSNNADGVIYDGEKIFEIVATAIREAREAGYKAGRESEAAMWELSRLGQEMELE